MPDSKRVRGERISDCQQTQQNSLRSEHKGEVTSRLPLSALLSQALIAFTLEFDREFNAKCEAADARVPPPSLALWANVMRFIGEEGVNERQLPVWSGISKEVIHFMLACLERHGWVMISPDPTVSRARLIRLTKLGRDCQEMWLPLLTIIEQHWRAQFGEDEINTLRRSLEVLLSQRENELPYYPMFNAYSGWRNAWEKKSSVDTAVRLPLFVLLSQTLIAFTLEFERETESSKQASESLALYSNVLRFLDEEGLPVRQLPALSGISKPVVSIAVNALEQRGQIVVEPHSTDSRTKLVRLTKHGRQTQDASWRLLAEVEQRWKAQFGEDEINTLRGLLKMVVGQHENELPHYPMAMAHRGGTPTGR